MSKFEIKEEFYLNGQPFKIISGAIHYFRTLPEYWEDRLIKLNNLGCNTVETYIPWNLHEAKEGEFNFEGILNLRRFIQLAHEIGLYVILRPSPYICAEWEFGGLPGWLLKYQNIKVRTSSPLFMEKVSKYYDRLFKEFTDLQVDFGGPILLFQIENEYGSYSNDKKYLIELGELMRKNGVVVPFITSDGPWGDMLKNGSVPEFALPTINCGSNIKEHWEVLKGFHQQKKPLMVTEFWIGWFDAWGDEYHHTTDIKVATKELEAILEQGSVNIYMFHGGTNFGFMNGSNYYEKLSPDVTSYDYDALLTEHGEITKKYLAFQEVIKKYNPNYKYLAIETEVRKINKTLKVENKVSLFSVLDDLSQPTESINTQNMEALEQSLGYIYYESKIGKARKVEDFRLIGCNDRASIYINEEFVATQYDLELGDKLQFELKESDNTMGILVENMGRVNYSVKMNHQKKGINDGVIINGAFHTRWHHYCLPMDNLEKIDFTEGWEPNQPGFYQFKFKLESGSDAFLDMTGWGKGFVVVNGFNIGRYWEIGPQRHLYVPGSLLKEENEIIVFESEGVYKNSLKLVDAPNLG